MNAHESTGRTIIAVNADGEIGLLARPRPGWTELRVRSASLDIEVDDLDMVTLVAYPIVNESPLRSGPPNPGIGVRDD